MEKSRHYKSKLKSCEKCGLVQKCANDPKRTYAESNFHVLSGLAMNREAVTAITELVGLAVVVASVIYIAIQTKQTNEHAIAASEIEWINAWNQILNSWVSDERTTSIIRRGFCSFKDLDPSEQAVFHMRIAVLVNQWLVVRKLKEKRLVGQDIVDEATKVVVATLATDGGFEYFEHDWKLFPGGAELLDLVQSSKGNQPNLTDLLPWWSDKLS